MLAAPLLPHLVSRLLLAGIASADRLGRAVLRGLFAIPGAALSGAAEDAWPPRFTNHACSGAGSHAGTGRLAGKNRSLASNARA